jgi:hypothetical protein
MIPRRAPDHIATPQDEDVRLNIAEHGTVSHVEKTTQHDLPSLGRVPHGHACLRFTTHASRFLELVGFAPPVRTLQRHGSMRHANALMVLLLIATLPPLGAARAQEAERHPIVILGNEEAASFSLRDRAGAHLVERCKEPCRLTLPRGRFRLELFDPEGTALGARSVRVNRGAIWTAAPQNTTKRDVGLGLGIGGLILLNVGAVLYLTNMNMHGDQSDAQATRAGVGLLMALGGAIATPIGWATFFGNLRPRLEVRPLEAGGY